LLALPLRREPGFKSVDVNQDFPPDFADATIQAVCVSVEEVPAEGLFTEKRKLFDCLFNSFQIHGSASSLDSLGQELTQSNHTERIQINKIFNNINSLYPNQHGNVN